MIPAHERPTLLVIAGPNGSGKTTLRQGLEARGIALPHHIDPDQIAATIEGDAEERSRAATSDACVPRSKMEHCGFSRGPCPVGFSCTSSRR